MTKIQFRDFTSESAVEDSRVAKADLAHAVTLIRGIGENMLGVEMAGHKSVEDFAIAADKLSKMITRLGTRTDEYLDLKPADRAKIAEALMALLRIKPTTKKIRGVNDLPKNQIQSVVQMRNIAKSKYLGGALRSTRTTSFDMIDFSETLRAIVYHYKLAFALWDGSKAKIEKAVLSDTSFENMLPSSVWKYYNKITGGE